MNDRARGSSIFCGEPRNRDRTHHKPQGAASAKEWITRGIPDRPTGLRISKLAVKLACMSIARNTLAVCS